MRNKTLTYTPSYVPLHHCVTIRLEGMTQHWWWWWWRATVFALTPASCLYNPSGGKHCHGQSKVIYFFFFFWESAPTSRCIVEQKLKQPWILLFQFKLPSAWWDYRVCVCVYDMMGYLQNDPEVTWSPCASGLSPHHFDTGFSVRFLSLYFYSDSFSASMSIMSFFLLLHFKGMWILTFMENTQILSHTFEVGLF